MDDTRRRRGRAAASRSVFPLLLLAALASCSTAQTPRYPPPEALRVTSIYVVARGWHTEIVMRRADIPPQIWPESADFAGATYLMIGWGDRDYYPSARFNPWYGLKALFWPTASVLHVVGFDASPVRRFADDEIVELGLTREGVEGLTAYIGASYDREGMSRAQPLFSSPEGPGWFYPSRQTFHLFRTCNVWVAKALQAAGVPVRSFLALTTESVMEQLRRLGRVIRPGTSTASCRAAGLG